MSSLRQLGMIGEEIAFAYLSRLGYHLLERNYRCRLGEIDLIMLDGSFIVFIEVKARRGTHFGVPQEAVGAAKQARIRRLAEHYLQCKDNEDYQLRFDVVAVSFHKAGSQVKQVIDHIKNAF